MLEFVHMNKDNLKISIKTFGCQMNEYDTELASGLLLKEGYEVISDEDKADVAIFNTCSVREHAEERVFGRITRLAFEKRERGRDLVLGMMGCMSENYKGDLFKRFPELDFVVGTRHVKDVPRIVKEVVSGKKRLMLLEQEGVGIEFSEFTQHTSSYHAWVPIMTGCDKVCTFCIVPKTRGAEISKSAEQVIEEVNQLAQRGYRAVTLLGQNVNSYGKEFDDDITFPKLLEKLAQIKGMEIISFTTSHPSDAIPELFEVMRDNPQITRRFHLPLQSGSDRILKKMKRHHNMDQYLEKIDQMRKTIPGVVITTDIIVGFPGETEEDFEATKKVLQDVRFHGAYIYKYSARPGTPAAENYEDDVPLEIKKRRNSELLDLQDRISVNRSEEMIGSALKVYVEKENPKGEGLLGRTWTDKKIVFPGPADLVGQIFDVKINELRNETFFGEKV